jgi:hypothetical protein
MSGTATISQNAARVRGPIAKIRVEGSPDASSRISRAICNPAAYCRIPFYQCYPYVFGETPEQMASEQDAACTTAHNDDVPSFVNNRVGIGGIILWSREFR